ncbi:MAG TPA: HemK/PrmC family methyltransferase [Actinomycetota bacterium]|nr:HemK/PrmC family methyltransferase [Actinomycetota bacterium]
MPTIREAIEQGRERLARSPAIEHWPPSRDRWESQQLLAHALGEEDPSELDRGAAITDRQNDRFRDLVRRRAGGEPMPHILGRMEFRGLELRIRPGAFVPRQSSEFMAASAAKKLRSRREPVHVDLATGMGPVALAVAAEVPRAEVHGTDLLDEGLRQARANARRLGLGNVSFHRGDLFGPLPRRLRGSVDVLTIHPPYVPKNEVEDLPLEVKGFEPETVLTDFSESGLGLVERTAEEGLEWLRPRGWVLIEISPDHTRAVKAVMRRAGYLEPRSTNGWPFVTRVVAGRAP